MAEVMPMGIEPSLEPDYVFASLVYSNIRTECRIKILEYSTLNMRESKVINNESFISYLKTGELDGKQWNDVAGLWKTWIPSKAKITWINIGGISWDVIKALQLRYCAWHKTQFCVHF